jgi:hypothetical protein
VTLNRGNPRLHVARKSAVEVVKAEADCYAVNVIPIIREASGRHRGYGRWCRVSSGWPMWS